MRKAFETSGPIDVRVRLPSGEVAVDAADTVETVVELEPRNKAAEDLIDEVRVELADSKLVVEAPTRWAGFRHSPEFGLRIRCPSGSSLGAMTASADVLTSGRLAELD